MNGKKLIKLSGSFLVLLGTVFGASVGHNQSVAPIYDGIKKAEPVAPLSMSAEKLTDAEPVLEITIPNLSQTPSSVTYEFKFYVSRTNSTVNNYLLGYYGDGDMYLPLTAKYQVSKDGKITEREAIIANSSSINPYVGFGSLLSTKDLNFFVHLEVDETETLDTDSLVLSNIFQAKRLETDYSYVPDIEHEYYVSASDCKLPDIKKSRDMLEISFKKFNRFNDHVSLVFDFDIDSLEVYKKVKSSLYNKNQDSIENNTYMIRNRLNSLTNTVFVIKYKDGSSKEISIRGSQITDLHFGKNEVNFLFSDIDVSKVTSIQMKSLTFYMDIAVTATRKKIVGSDFTVLFGDFTFVIDNQKITDINMIVIISTIVLFIVSIGIGVGIYIYRKNKYKNDEFRRMNTKKFIKQALIFFLGGASFFYFFLFIVLRANVLDNTLTVYNPCDIPITIFGVLSIIMFGYFVKYFITLYRAYATKVRAKKLNLNVIGEKADDGTN